MGGLFAVVVCVFAVMRSRNRRVRKAKIVIPSGLFVNLPADSASKDGSAMMPAYTVRILCLRGQFSTIGYSIYKEIYELSSSDTQYPTFYPGNCALGWCQYRIKPCR